MRKNGRRPAPAPKTSIAPRVDPDEVRSILARTEELLLRINRGGRPEDMIDKGHALREIDKERPWRFDGTRTKNVWCEKNLPYKVAYANEYRRMAESIRVEKVAGKKLNHDQMVVLSMTPEARQDELIALAEAGVSARKLGRILDGEDPDATSIKDAAAYAEKAAGLYEKAGHAVRLLVHRVHAGEQVIPQMWCRLRDDLRRQLALLGPFLPSEIAVEPAAPAQTGAETDPKGSVSTPAPPTAASAKTDPKGSVSAPTQPAAASAQADPKGSVSAPAPPTADDRQTHLRELGAPYVPLPLPPQPGIPVHDEWPATWRTEYLSPRKVKDPILFGASAPSPQHGTLARCTLTGERIGLDFNGNFASFFFSTPGGGKTYALNVITHMALALLRNINVLPAPLCGVALHNHPDDSHDPEALSLRFPNRDAGEVRYLVEEVGGTPEGLEDILLLCPDSRVEIMRLRYPHVEVQPLCYATREVGATEYQLLLGLDEARDSRVYTRQIRMAMREVARRGPMNLMELEHALLAEDLSTDAANRVRTRLRFARQHICDELPLLARRRAGRLIIVDTRDPWMTRQESMMLGTLTLSILLRREADQPFNMLLRVDEVADLLKDPGFRALADLVLRKRRHLRVSPLFATQYAQHVPLEMLSNADLIGVGRMQSEETLRYLARAKDPFRGLSAAQTAELEDGEMYIWAERRYIDEKMPDEVHSAVLPVQIRSQTAQHGGATHRAVEQRQDTELDFADTNDESDDLTDKADDHDRQDEGGSEQAADTHALAADSSEQAADTHAPAADQDEELDYEEYFLSLDRELSLRT